MTLQELIKDNPSGFTFNLTTGKMAKHRKGFYVALTNNCFEDLEDCDKFIKAFNFFKNVCSKDVYIGGWSEKDKYYLDYVIHVKTYGHAIDIADEFNQQAIFDCEDKTSVFVN